MDILTVIFLSVVTFLCGIACTLILEFYVFKKYLESAPEASPPKKPVPHGKAALPEELFSKIKEENTNFSGSPLRQGFNQGNENLAINLTLQFLFNELRNAERVRLWLYRKLNNEFKELLNQTTTGRLFDSVQLRDLHLGNQFPMIKGLEVAGAKICADTGLLETLDLSLDLHYSGNFQLSIDVKMLLGKTAYLALQVKRVTGKARLQFTRVPYTHWSLSFYTDPILELEVQSQFQGRQLQPQIISLITGQIRRAVRRKHTLPRYKMRYKPFFRRLNDEDIDLSEPCNFDQFIFSKECCVSIKELEFKCSKMLKYESCPRVGVQRNLEWCRLAETYQKSLPTTSFCGSRGGLSVALSLHLDPVRC